VFFLQVVFARWLHVMRRRLREFTIQPTVLRTEYLRYLVSIFNSAL
jgi:hypothetical protein